MENTALPPVPADKARFYVFREAEPSDQPPLRTRVSSNGNVIGTIAPASVFYRDVAPGTYEIEVQSNQLYPFQFKTVYAEAGSTIFIRIDSLWHWGNTARKSLGITYVVNIVDPPEAWRHIATLHYTPG